jgi:hypothetical protein
MTLQRQLLSSLYLRKTADADIIPTIRQYGIMGDASVLLNHTHVFILRSNCNYPQQFTIASRGLFSEKIFTLLVWIR